MNKAGIVWAIVLMAIISGIVWWKWDKITGKAAQASAVSAETKPETTTKPEEELKQNPKKELKISLKPSDGTPGAPVPADGESDKAPTGSLPVADQPAQGSRIFLTQKPKDEAGPDASPALPVAKTPPPANSRQRVTEKKQLHILRSASAPVRHPDGLVWKLEPGNGAEFVWHDASQAWEEVVPGTHAIDPVTGEHAVCKGVPVAGDPVYWWEPEQVGK